MRYPLPGPLPPGATCGRTSTCRQSTDTNTNTNTNPNINTNTNTNPNSNPHHSPPPYLQAINEINAIKADPHVWQHDGDMAEAYGLEPNYGCCTANFHQVRVRARARVRSG